MPLSLFLRLKFVMNFGICLCLGYALLEFGFSIGLNSSFTIFGPIIGFGSAIYLVFGKKSTLPLMLAAPLVQILSLYGQNKILTLEVWYGIAITTIFFVVLVYLNAKIFLRIEKIYDESNIKGVIQFFCVGVLSAALVTFVAFFTLSTFAALKTSDIHLLVGISAFSQYIGSILSVPLIRSLFSVSKNVNNSEIKRLVLPLWIGFFFTFLFILLLNSEIEKKLKIEFQKVSVEVSNLIEAQFYAQDAFIDGVAAFFSNNSIEITEDHFKSYVAHGLIRYPMIQGISWLTLLKPEQLPEFVRIQRKIYPDYEIKALGSNEDLVKEGARPFYTPVTFIEPNNINRKALGFDISSNALRLTAAQDAMASLKIVATAPIKLVQDQTGKMGILLLKFVPNSRNGPGFVSEVLRLEDFIGLTTKRLSDDANIRVVDAESKSIIFDNQFNPSKMAISRPLIFGGRVFDIDMSPTEDFLEMHHPLKYKFYMGALASLILLFLNSYLLLSLRFQQKIEEKVTSKTKELYQSEQQLKYVLDATGDGIWDWNIKTGMVDHNRRWLELLGLDPDQENSTVEDYKNHIHPDDLPQVMRTIEEALQLGHKYSLEYRMIRGDEGLIWVSDIGMVVDRSSNGEPLRMVGAISDITKQRGALAKIEELAFFDPVTNLPNRRYIKDRIQRAISESARCDGFAALMFIDLDNFKFINDSFGHHAGDSLLKQFGSRLGAALRPLDVVARIGGDEFLVLFERQYPSVEQAQAILKIVIERVLDILSDPFEVAPETYVNLKPSVGIVIFGEDSGGFEEVMKFADLAMYRNKINPDERYRFYDGSLHQEFLEMSELARGLKDACKLEQLYVDYQPVVDRNKVVMAYEALTRWEHPKLGKIMPDKFIPFAEKNGLIRDVGTAIFKKIFENPQIMMMRSIPQPCIIMINLSGIHLMDINFAQDFIDTANKFQFPLNLIHLEVTEGVFMDDKNQVIRTMQILRELGVKFSLDDFGTGYSSFSYLQRLPIDCLKIDKSFVSNMERSQDGKSIVKNIILLAHALRLQVIAEGVETESQFNLLYSMECDYFQGWYCGRPGPLPPIEL